MVLCSCFPLERPDASEAALVEGSVYYFSWMTLSRMLVLLFEICAIKFLLLGVGSGGIVRFIGTAPYWLIELIALPEIFEEWLPPPGVFTSKLDLLVERFLLSSFC